MAGMKGNVGGAAVRYVKDYMTVGKGKRVLTGTHPVLRIVLETTEVGLADAVAEMIGQDVAISIMPDQGKLPTK